MSDANEHEMQTPETAPDSEPQAPPPPPPPPQSASTWNEASRPASPFKKTPALAGLLSFLPGLGHIYNGLYLRGMTFFLIFAALMGLANRGNGEPFFILGTIFFWFFSVFDSYRQAVLLNYGYAFEPMPDHPPQGGGFTGGGLAAGVILVLLGIYGVLEEYVPAFDIDWILDQWPFILIAFGAWMIFQAVRGHKDSGDGVDDLGSEI